VHEVGCFTQDDPQRAAELAGWLAEQLGALAGHFSSVPEADASSEPQPAAELRSYAASSLAQSEQWLRGVAEQGAQPDEEGSVPGIASLAAHLNDVSGALHGAAELQMGAAAAADEEATAAGQEDSGASPPRTGSLVEAREAASTELNALRESLQAEADAEHDGSDALGEAVTAHIQRVLESLQVRGVFARGPCATVVLVNICTSCRCMLMPWTLVLHC